MQFLYILSQGAGIGDSIYLDKEIQKLYADAGKADKVNIIRTTHAGHAAQAAKDFADEYGDQGVVYICGGDGSTNEVANALALGKCPMGVLPYGTANDFTKSLYPRLERKEMVRKSISPIIQPIDLIQYSIDGHHENSEIEEVSKTARWGINVLSTGFDTLVLKKAYDILERHPRLGGGAYFLAVAQSLGKIQSMPYRVTLQDEKGAMTFKEDYLLVVVGNGGYYGNGFNPVPDSDVSDGKLDMLRVTDVPRMELPGLLFKYHKGTHVGHPAAHIDRLRRGCIEALGHTMIGNIDGFIFHASKVDFEVVPNALPFAFFE